MLFRKIAHSEGWSNPSHRRRRPRTLSWPQERSGSAFFVGKLRMLRHPLVNKDVEEGIRVGVPVIPTLFINGRLLVSAQPLASFVPISRACCSRALTSRIWQRAPVCLTSEWPGASRWQRITARL